MQYTTPFEEYLLLASQPSRMLSSLYNILGCPPAASQIPFVRAWEAELSTTFTAQDWQKSFILTHKLPVDCFSQEKNYKILTRWYRYPTLLRKVYSTTSDSCWQCNLAPGTMLHICWDCTLLLPFWESVFSLHNSLYILQDLTYLCHPQSGQSHLSKKGTLNIF